MCLVLFEMSTRATGKSTLFPNK